MPITSDGLGSWEGPRGECGSSPTGLCSDPYILLPDLIHTCLLNVEKREGEQKERSPWDLPLHRQTTVHVGLGRHLGRFGHNLSSPSLRKELLLFISFICNPVAPGTCARSPAPCAGRRVPSCGAAAGWPSHPRPGQRGSTLRSPQPRAGRGWHCSGSVRARLLGTEWPAVLSRGEPLALPPHRGWRPHTHILEAKGLTAVCPRPSRWAPRVVHLQASSLGRFPGARPSGLAAPDTLPDAAPHQTARHQSAHFEPNSGEPPACRRGPGSLPPVPSLSCRCWDLRLTR